MATTATDQRLARLASPLGGGAAVLAVSVALHFRDPHEPGSWGVCPTAYLFGLDCPACGSLRTVHHLTNLDIVSAASSNLLLLAIAPIAVFVWIRRVQTAWVGVVPPSPVVNLGSQFGLRSAVDPDASPMGTAGSPRQIRVARRAWWFAFVALAAVFTVIRNLPLGQWLHS
jgi:Protein of unknown function (DUF2752)